MALLVAVEEVAEEAAVVEVAVVLQVAAAEDPDGREEVPLVEVAAAPDQALGQQVVVEASIVRPLRPKSGCPSVGSSVGVRT